MAPIIPKSEKEVPRIRNRSRLETNLLRLLSRCETMAMDTEHLQENWRLEKYVEALEVMLNELKTGPNLPERDIILDYGRKIDFIKGILNTSKMSSVNEKAVASQLINPGFNISSDNNDHNRSMEIKHRHVTKYAKDLRRELIGEEIQSTTVTDGAGGNTLEDIDEILKYHHKKQEALAEDMVELTRSLKEQARSAGDIIKKDTKVLEQSSKLMDANQGSLKVESEKLEMYNKSACKCWVWLLLFIVCSVFIAMVLFMRLFKKRIVPSS